MLGVAASSADELEPRPPSLGALDGAECLSSPSPGWFPIMTGSRVADGGRWASSAQVEKS